MVRVLGKLEPGGAQLALLRLSRELHRRHGVQTMLLVGDATADGVRLAQRYGLQPIVFRFGSAVAPLHNLQWQLSPRFAMWLADKLSDADLVHAHMVGAWWAVAQSIEVTTPLIATEHNEVNWAPRRLRSLRQAAGRVDRFYAMGPSARAFALAAGVRAEVIRASRSPVAGLSTAPRSDLPRPRLTFAGRLCHDKGPDVLIGAISLLQRPDLAVYLLGDGPMRARLTSMVGKQDLTRQVRMPGWVDKPGTYVAGSSVHVVPSREEAWSQSAVLALGLGVPVVGTRVDGLAATLSQSRGLIVAPDDPVALRDAITSALAGSAPIDRAAGIRYARQFTSSRVADFYLAEYENVLDAARGRHRMNLETQ